MPNVDAPLNRVHPPPSLWAQCATLDADGSRAALELMRPLGGNGVGCTSRIRLLSLALRRSVGELEFLPTFHGVGAGLYAKHASSNFEDHFPCRPGEPFHLDGNISFTVCPRTTL